MHAYSLRLCNNTKSVRWGHCDKGDFSMTNKQLFIINKCVSIGLVGVNCEHNNKNHVVATLALGSKPRQGFARAQAKRETRECGRMWEWTFTLPSELPCWELESQGTPEFSKNDCKGQNPSPWRIIYIIGKLLKWRCLKWVRMTHLDIWNTSYGKKKGQKSNW
jgi:hypothetical protein